MSGSQNRTGDVRPRVVCPSCGQSRAVTFNSLGGVYLRQHRGLAAKGQHCSGSGRDVRHLPTHYPERAS